MSQLEIDIANNGHMVITLLGCGIVAALFCGFVGLIKYWIKK